MILLAFGKRLNCLMRLFVIELSANFLECLTVAESDERRDGRGVIPDFFYRKLATSRGKCDVLVSN